MEKLTWLETLEAEKQEKIRAKKKASLQTDQRQKRLRYLPILLEYIVLSVWLLAMYVLVFWAGMVTGEATREKQEYSCPIVPCPVVKECLLPATGAN